MITDLEEADMTDAVVALIEAAGPHGRSRRRLLALLASDGHDLASLVRASGLPRATVEEVLAAVGPDLHHFSLRPEVREAYAERFDFSQLAETAPADPLAHLVRPELVHRMAALIAGAPAARQSLDHVSATAETAVRRALWLNSTYDLAGARLLCVGDHDLTALAAGLVAPGLSTLVVDVDERLLAYISSAAAELGLDVTCRWTDLRHGLPPAATGWGDLVFTDPPYTPDGVRLFLARGLAGLRDREQGRLLMAYGYGDRHPLLGWKVQAGIHELGLAYQAVLPAFNAYHGAQAVGSVSDLYVLQPTSRSWQVLPAVERSALSIYTHGAQSVESRTYDLHPASAERLLHEAGDVVLKVGFDGGVSLADFLSGPLAPNLVPRGPYSVAVDASGDPGGWLHRAVLAAAGAERVAVLAPNTHPDLADQAGQRSLAALLGPGWRLKFLRSTPDPKRAILVAARTEAPHPLLAHPFGQVGGTLRDALVKAGRREGAALTRADARTQLSETYEKELLAARPVDLPRAELAALLAASVAAD